MAEHTGEHPAAGPGWPDWQRWVEDVDWSDWRSWLRRIASADWAAGPWPGAPWDQAPRGDAVSLTLRAFAEDEPGDRIREHLAAIWPAFRRWWRDGANARPAAGQAGARLEEHMPELIPAWQQLTAMLGDDPDAAAALALWNPPPFLTGCSQAVVLPGGPALIRNYDWDYRLFDAVAARTGYGGRRVVGMLDCLWGLLDGVNDAGLAVSLTFGGRPQVGEGFGIPLVIRYVLRVCGSVEDALRVLRRVPVHMSYNVTALDRDGRRATVYLAPDRPAQVTSAAVTTNHQGTVEWAPYAAAIRTVERHERLEKLVTSGGRPRRRRGLPAAAAVRHTVRRGLRNLVHRRVPARRGHRPLPLAAPHLGTLAGPARTRQHPDPARPAGSARVRDATAPRAPSTAG